MTVRYQAALRTDVRLILLAFSRFAMLGILTAAFFSSWVFTCESMRWWTKSAVFVVGVAATVSGLAKSAMLNGLIVTNNFRSKI